VFQPVRIADDDDLLPLPHLFRIAQRQRRQLFGGDANYGQIERAVRSVDFDDVVLGAVGHLHGNRARFAEHVQVGGDQAVLGDHKPGAQALPPPVAPGDADHDHGCSHFGGENFSRVCMFRRRGFLGGRVCRGGSRRLGRGALGGSRGASLFRACCQRRLQEEDRQQESDS